MAIHLIDGFKINRSVPIDDKTVVQTYADLSTIDYAYVGLRTYVIADDAEYIWTGSIWRLISSGSGSYILQPATVSTLGGIKVGANLSIDLNGVLSGSPVYTHPAQHPASIIIQDTNNRFVTDAQISSWNSKENAIAAGTTSQYWRGDKSWQTLDKVAIGLSNVDNTSDANKPISLATQDALDDIILSINGFEPAIIAGTVSQYYRGDKTWQTLDKNAIGLSNVPNINTSITSGITDSFDKRFVTDAQLLALANISGINTGDETQATIKSKLGYVTSLVDGYLRKEDFNIFAAKQDPLGFTPVPNTRTVNSKALNVNIVLDKTDIGLSNVPNLDTTNPVNIVQSANYRFVTDTEKSTWNSKQDALGFIAVPNTRTVNGKALNVNITLDKTDIGLSNVPNIDTSLASNITEDANNMFVSLTQIDYWDAKQAALGFTPENFSNKGIANGYASLDATGKVPLSQLPTVTSDSEVIEVVDLSALAGTIGQTGKLYVILSDNTIYRYTGLSYVKLSAFPTTTDGLTEGFTNKYFTESRVRSTILTGLSVADNSSVLDSDNIVTGIGKVQAEINYLSTNKVDKDGVKVLSDENYTTAEKQKLFDISGTNTGDETAQSIEDKFGPHPTLLSQLTNDPGFITDQNNYLDMTPVTPPIHEAGRVFFDSVEDALSYYNSVSGVTLQIGREIWVRVRNISGSLITNGSAVFISGSNSGIPTIELADCTNYVKSRIIGVATMDIPSDIGGTGYVTFFGRVHELNTFAFPAGTTLYLKEGFPGELTNIPPSGGCYKTRIGVVSESHISLGSIEVNISPSEYTIEVMSETGFPDRTQVTLSFNNGTRSVTITPVGTEFRYYERGEKYIKTAAESFAISNVEGSHIVYYNGTTLAELVNGTTAQITSIIRNYATVAYIYWNATDLKAEFIGGELHNSIGYGVEAHIIDHVTTGARYGTGLSPTNVSIVGTGDLNADAQFGVTSGLIYDEDIPYNIQALGSTVGVTNIYYVDLAGKPRTTSQAGFSVKTTGTGRLAYNPVGGGLVEVTNTNFVWYHLFACGAVDSQSQIVTFIGRSQFTSDTTAFAGLQADIVAVQQSGLPSPEFKAIASFLYQTNNTYANTVKARIRPANTAGSSFVDWRTSNLAGGGIVGGGGTSQTVFSDTEFKLYDNLTISKELQFELSGLPTGLNQVAITKAGTVAMLSDISAGSVDEGFVIAMAVAL